MINLIGLRQTCLCISAVRWLHSSSQSWRQLKAQSRYLDRQLRQLRRPFRFSLPVDYHKAPITAPPTATPNNPSSSTNFFAPFVGEAAAAEELLVGVLLDEAPIGSEPLTFVSVPVYAIDSIPVPLLQGPGWAESENLMSAH